MKDGMWKNGMGKILPGDKLVGMDGTLPEKKEEIAYFLCQRTVGKTEVRFEKFKPALRSLLNIQSSFLTAAFSH
jgi:hypothetical protein